MSVRSLRERADKAISAMYEARREYEFAWKRYRRAFAPHRGVFAKSDAKRTKVRFRRNSRPYMVPSEFAAGMKGGLTNPSTPWFNLTVFDKRVANSERVRSYLSECRDIMLAAFLRTNIYDQLTDFFEEEGIFGTGAMVIDDDDEDIFRARVYTIGEFAIGGDSSHRIDRIAVRRLYSARQMIDEFGEANVPYTVRRSQEDVRLSDDQSFVVNHMIWPNPEFVPGMRGQKGFPFQSLKWVNGDIDDEKPFLKISGYHEFPAMVARWKIIGDDVYGRGHPGEIAIDDAEAIQKMETASREAVQKMVDPPMLADEELNNGGLDKRSGAVTWYRAQNNLPPPQAIPLFAMAFDVSAVEGKIDSLKSDINRAFYVDLFRMWSEDMRRNRTATEVQTREQEKMYVLSPIIERQMSELLDPMISRVFAIMERRGYFGERPPEIAQYKLKVEYSSVLANLAKQSAMAGIDAVVNRLATLAQIQAATGERPSVLDTMDMDEAIQQTADGYNVPVGIIFGDDKIAEVRAAREQELAAMQQQQQMLQMAQNAPNVANAAKNMSETPMGDSNALDATLAALGLGGGTQGVDSQFFRGA